MKVKALPLPCSGVHTDEDGGAGDGSHGGALAEGGAGENQIGAQVRAKHSWVEGSPAHVTPVAEKQIRFVCYSAYGVMQTQIIRLLPAGRVAQLMVRKRNLNPIQ